MPTPKSLSPRERAGIWIGFVVLLAIAFIQCFRTTHDLFWPFDVDFDRDMSFVQSALDGAYGRDPSYLHEWLWYNPLLFGIETGLVRLTGLPINVLIVRGGIYLNIFGPIFFFLMCWRLFDPRVALAAALSYLFLAPGKTMLVIGATYTPWLYPSEFMLFAFYLDIILCYMAFHTGKWAWFAGLGLAAGVTFLGHAAPAVIIVLIVAGLQTTRLIGGLRRREYPAVRKYLLQGLVALGSFLLAASPILYYILGKYHLHIINREPSEYTEDLFFVNHFWGLLKANFSVSLLVALVGLGSFYRSFPRGLARQIVFWWLAVALGMYCYATLATSLDRHGIRLAMVVPSFHYFMYLKALQSVFFGFGLVFLLRPLLQYATVAIVAIAVVNLPFYVKREDFVKCRELSIAKAANRDGQEVYEYILHKLQPDEVVLCDLDHSLFPVLATGRKMVSTAYTFSNPYVDFISRERDRVAMLGYIRTGQQAPLKKLLTGYNVGYVLLTDSAIKAMTPGAPPPGKVVLRNDTFTLFALR
jgi:hypothetical protein